MHEMSIVASILSIVEEEIAKNQATTLRVVRVCYGALSNVVPDALQFGFEAQTVGTSHEGACLELVKIPVILQCCACKKEFTPEEGQDIFTPCPDCGQPLGHTVKQGNELYVQNIEVE